MEAASILYGSNTFEFKNRYTVQAFLSLIGGKATLLRNVTLLLGPDRWLREQKQPDALRVMTDPECIELRFEQEHNGILEDAFARCIYPKIASILGMPHRLGVLDREETLDKLALLKRFDAVHVCIPKQVEVTHDSVDQWFGRMEDDKERGSKVKVLVRGLLLEHLEAARKGQSREDEEHEAGKDHDGKYGQGQQEDAGGHDQDTNEGSGAS